MGNHMNTPLITTKRLPLNVKSEFEPCECCHVSDGWAVGEDSESDRVLAQAGGS